MVCTDLIDQSQTSVLNGSVSHASVLEVLAANPEDKAMASDADPQMLVKVVFKEKINLASVCVRFPTPPKDEDETYSKPRLLKLFCNHEDLDFSDIEEIPASAKCIVEDGDATEAKITCIGHKFQGGRKRAECRSVRPFGDREDPGCPPLSVPLPLWS